MTSIDSKSAVKILLTGVTGQVGRELKRALAPLGNLVALNRKDMDLSNPGQIREVIRQVKPNLIINAAAYTAVDKAEEEIELAKAINQTAPGIIAEEAEKIGAPL
ncbi:MAG: sugar nucleotide-binding protein, partial [Nitrospinae bacterium]|nr:sugar nucleotide-binding protein [Nitrospinota bacterium]